MISKNLGYDFFLKKGRTRDIQCFYQPPPDDKDPEAKPIGMPLERIRPSPSFTF